MAVKKEIEDIKKSLEMLHDNVEKIAVGQDKIMDLMGEIKALKLLNAEKDKIINDLENRVSDLEQYSRINDVVITGLKTKPRSYAKAVEKASGEVMTEDDRATVEEQVVAFLKTRRIAVDHSSIEACHPLPQRNTTQPPAIILRFTNRKHKTWLLKQWKLLKGSNVYLNEHLTKRNGDIAKKARFLRKQGKIQSTWTFNCKIFIRLNGAPEEAQVKIIKELKELDVFQ